MTPRLTGMRFRLVRDVERYPFFIAPAGSVGTVTADYADELHAEITFKLDDHLPGSEDWDNSVQWYDDWQHGDVIEGARDAFLRDARALLTGDVARAER